MNDIQRLNPINAFNALQESPNALLIDVRDPVEYGFVGHPLNAINVPWAFAPEMRRNDDFIEQVKRLAPNPETPLFLLCRSGQRSYSAAQALQGEGYQHLVNVEEGFEGTLDDSKHRSSLNGWRFHGLPWQQG